MKTLAKGVMALCIILSIPFGFMYLLTFGGKFAMANLAEMRESGRELMTQHQTVDARGASIPCYRDGKGGNIGGIGYTDEDKVDRFCQGVEALRNAPSGPGMDDLKKRGYCDLQVELGNFVNATVCENYSREISAAVTEANNTHREALVATQTEPEKLCGFNKIKFRDGLYGIVVGGLQRSCRLFK